jgi:D-glycero-alpha-D-manno-heptose-7-phosphate kinase
MIISRTPYRISLVGGGTDLRSFYSKEPGQVLSTTIDKFLYVVVKRQIGIVEFKYRINWSRVEFRNSIDEIEHPIVREALKYFNIDFPIEISTFADIPANTGLGSSSAFAVGLVHALRALKGQTATKYSLASDAAMIEVDILGRTMGKQDHFASAYGNFNVFTFNANETVTVDPVFYRPESLEQLQKNLMLFYTGLKRDASEVLTSQNEATPGKYDVLVKMKGLVEPLREVLSKGDDLRQVGEILHEGWMMKKSLTKEISTSTIDDNYLAARNAGAIGGKILGAGGGGFLLFYVEQDKQKAVVRALPGLAHIKMGFDSSGSRITYYDQTIL